MQLKPGVTLAAGELTEFVRERTPERAAVPVQVYFIDAIPLTAVGKVFKPALRWDSTQRAVSRMLTDVAPAGATVKVEAGPHAVHGGLITVRIGGVTETERASIAQQVGARLDPLVTKHQIVWA